MRQLHAAWAKSVGRPGDKLRATGDDAYRLAWAIRERGLEECLLVANHCAKDPRVNGKASEGRDKFNSIKYLFCNDETFGRILALARDASKPKHRELTATELKKLGRF